MPEWPEEVMEGIDAARPLSPELRSRLHGALGRASDNRAIDDRLAARLQGALADPLATAMADVDSARPLSPSTRRSIERAFAHRDRPWLRPAAVAAGLLLLAGVATAVSLGGHGAPPRQAASPATHPSLNGTSARSQSNFGSAGAAGAAGGSSSAADSAIGATSGAPSPSASAALPPATGVAPRVTSLDPGSGPSGGGTWVVVTGTGFSGVRSVALGSQDTSFVVVSDTMIRALVPRHADGDVYVLVTTATGTSASQPSSRYRYVG